MFHYLKQLILHFLKNIIISSCSVYGGNCQVFKKYAKVGENGITYLIGLDENNLYGFSARKLLPYGEFTFINNKIKLVYSVNDLGDYCLFSEFLKQLLENNWYNLDKIYEVV